MKLDLQGIIVLFSPIPTMMVVPCKKLGVKAIVDFPVASGTKKRALLKLRQDGLEVRHPVRDREVLLQRVKVVKIKRHRGAVVPTDLALSSEKIDGPDTKGTPLRSYVKATAPAVNHTNRLHRIRFLGHGVLDRR